MAGPLSLIGHRGSPATEAARKLLERNGVDFRFVVLGEDPLGAMLREDAIASRRLPLVLFPDGSCLEGPSRYANWTPGRLDPGQARVYAASAQWRTELARRAGLATRPQHSHYDLLVIGAGPAGLTAAMYAASEGLRTLVIEQQARADRPAPAPGSKTTSASPRESAAPSSQRAPMSRPCDSARSSSSASRCATSAICPAGAASR